MEGVWSCWEASIMRENPLDFSAASLALERIILPKGKGGERRRNGGGKGGGKGRRNLRGP